MLLTRAMYLVVTFTFICQYRLITLGGMQDLVFPSAVHRGTAWSAAHPREAPRHVVTAPPPGR